MHLEPHITPEVTLRFATAADADGLRRLAELDSAPTPSGEVLLAEVDGVLRAALPLDGTAPIADPFRRSVELVDLLRTRVAQVTEAPPRHPGRVATTLSALERRIAYFRPPKPLHPL